MVHRVGIVLALDGYAVVVRIAAAGLGFGAAAREPVARVDHHAGLRGEHLDAAARPRVAQAAHLAQDIGPPAVDHERVVVSLEVADVVELRVYAGPERPVVAEVLRRAGHVEQPARRNLPFVHFERLRGVEPQFVVEHRSRAVAREVEIDMVREIHDRRPVGPGRR